MKFELYDIVETTDGSIIYRIDNVCKVDKLYNSNLNAEEIEDRYSFYESELKLVASKDKVFSCRRCGEDLSNTEMSPGYVFGCDTCDEDFYYFEVA